MLNLLTRYSNLVLHCSDLHLQQLLPLLPPALGHHLGLGGHQGAQALLHSGLGDQQGLAGLQGAHQLLPDLQLVAEDERAGCMDFKKADDSNSDFVFICLVKIGCTSTCHGTILQSRCRGYGSIWYLNYTHKAYKELSMPTINIYMPHLVC